MRRIIVLFLIAFPLCAFAASEDASDAVSMVSYEQGWLDVKGTLALRNNTDETVRNVTYQIKYLDMNGKDLDYEKYTTKVDIAPGMTKKVDIPAYEHDRHYSFYTSEASISEPRKFKISFEVISYNDDLSADDEVLDEDGRSLNFGLNGGGSMASVIMLLIIIGVCVGLYVLVAQMAKRRNRNAALWVLVSLFATPVLAIILLLCIGPRD